MNRLAMALLVLSGPGLLAQGRLTIETESELPDGAVGLPYLQTLTARGGERPYVWSVVGGSLPTGLTLVGATGTIAGVPTAAGNYRFDVRVQDDNDERRQKSFRITITDARPPVIGTTSLASATVGQPYSQSLSATGGSPPYTWSVSAGSLPGGIALNSSTGALSGTPTAAGTFSFTARVTDSRNSSATKALSLVVNAPPLVITTAGLAAAQVGQAYAQSLAASGGTPPYEWSTAGGTLPPGISLSASGALSGTPTAAGTYDFTARVRDAANTNAIKSLRISVSPSPVAITTSSLSGGQVGVAYSASLAATGGTPPYSWTVVGGTVPSGLTVAPTGAISGSPTTAGTFDFTVRAEDSARTSATQVLRIVISPPAAPPLTISTSALPPGTVGQSYSQALSATGGSQPYVWAVASGTPPTGLTVAPSGAITGTPTTTGDFDFIARVTDSTNGSATKALRISIGPAAAPPLSITTPALPSGTAGQPYAQTLSATGGVPPYAWATDTGSLPPGLSLNTSGAIAGTPSTAGSFDFAVRVTDSSTGLATRAFRIVITPAAAPLTITTEAIPAAIVGQPYSAPLTATGGTGPYSWSLAAGTLPTGIVVSPSGGLGGTASDAGEFDFVVRVTDAAAASATKVLRLSVPAPQAPLTITTPALASGTAGVEYLQAMSATGGRPPYVWSAIAGSLPPGLSLDGVSGRLAGTPLSSGSYTATVRVTDADNRTADRMFTISIGGALAVAGCPAGSGRTGTPYSGILTASGGRAPYFWSVASGQLPPGIALDAPSGNLSGTPTVFGSFAFSVTVADANGATASRSCGISIEAPLEIMTDSLPDATTRATYSQRLSAQGGTAPFVWSIGSGALPAGLTLDSASGTISGQPTQPGRFSFAVTLADGTGRQVQRLLSISVVTGLAVPECPTATTTVGQMYSSALVAIGGATPYTWSLTAGSLPQGIALVAETGLISGRATESGLAQFTVSVGDAAGSTATRTCTISAAPELRLITSAVAAGRLRGEYSQTLEAEGGTPPYLWALISGALPPGLTLNAATGTIAGAPAASGMFRFTARLTDAAGIEIDRAFELAVAAGLTISACPTPVAVADEPYSSGLSVNAARQPVVWALASGSLPDGLALSAEGGTITGTPAVPGTFEFSIRATDAANDAASRTCSIAVSAAPLRISAPDVLSTAVLGSEYRSEFRAAGGRVPYVWSLADGTLPPGLSLDGGGAVTGTPSEVGTYRFTLRVGDQDRAVATRSFELRVLAAVPPSIRFSEMPEILPPAQQPRVRLALDSGYPAELRGTLALRFQPDPGLVDDPSIRFVTGGRTAPFSVAANSTDCVFSVPELALQTGSVAGTIELSVRLFAGETEITPDPIPVRNLRVDRTAPVIGSVRLNQTAGGVEVVIVGISPTRDVTRATFEFTPAAGSRLESTQVTVSTEEAARRWFQDGRSAEFGGQFTFVQPFSVQGASISEVSVTLTNGQGTSQPVRAGF